VTLSTGILRLPWYHVVSVSPTNGQYSASYRGQLHRSCRHPSRRRKCRLASPKELSADIRPVASVAQVVGSWRRPECRNHCCRQPQIRRWPPRRRTVSQQRRPDDNIAKFVTTFRRFGKSTTDVLRATTTVFFRRLVFVVELVHFG